ncbi:hypothetical protein Vqi01_08270 [Micromonospora qiuiae]|uniref:Secreted protein n=1 Tax=Micromonospora qiuiae TaxID=502268 RepID=A0ABQ4J669_9ACTN|nr:hypothetical protein Vqi01_08270 [Micromonospora qiuiae]
MVATRWALLLQAWCLRLWAARVAAVGVLGCLGGRGLRGVGVSGLLSGAGCGMLGCPGRLRPRVAESCGQGREWGSGAQEVAAPYAMVRPTNSLLRVRRQWRG